MGGETWFVVPRVGCRTEFLPVKNKIYKGSSWQLAPACNSPARRDELQKAPVQSLRLTCSRRDGAAVAGPAAAAATTSAGVDDDDDVAIRRADCQDIGETAAASRPIAVRPLGSIKSPRRDFTSFRLRWLVDTDFRFANSTAYCLRLP